jgi:hypothetical protein
LERIIINDEINLLIKYACIVRCEKAQRIRWIGHVVGMDKGRRVKRITDWRPIEVRKIGRQRLRWERDIREDLGKRRFRIGVRWQWTEKHGREMMSRPKLMKSCSAKRQRM